MKNIRIYLGTVFWIMGALLILSSLQAHADDDFFDRVRAEQDREYEQQQRDSWAQYDRDSALMYQMEVQNQNANAVDQDLIMLNQSLRINGR